jgi:phosphoglycerate-specific signal transduction histidine kinase
MTDNLTDFLPMQDLDTDHIKALIHHYLSVKQKLPDNLTVRDRLEELQAELINRSSTIEGMIRQNTNNPL